MRSQRSAGVRDPESAAGPWSALVVNRPGFVLSGALERAWSRRPAPALLILPGAGPTDADGNTRAAAAGEIGGMGHGPYAQLAAILARHGYAVARFHKNGPPQTGHGRWRTIEERAEDCAAMAAALRVQAGVDGDRLVLVGHGEGGLVAMEACRASSAAAVVLLETPAVPAPALVAEQLKRSGRDDAAHRLQALKSFRNRVAADADEREIEYEGRVLPPAAVRYFRSLYASDPARLARGVDVPALVVQGGSDLVVAPANGRALVKELPRGTLETIDGMSYGLALAPGFRDPHSARAVPLHPRLIWALLDWLGRTLCAEPAAKELATGRASTGLSFARLVGLPGNPRLEGV